MKTKWIVTGLCTFTLLAIAATAVISSRTAPPVQPRTTRLSFDVKGEIRGFEDDGKRVVISHEDIPGFMPAMTMPFAVKDSELLQGLQPGDRVGFTLVVTKDDSWISQMNKLSEVTIQPDGTGSQSDSANASAEPSTRVEIGQTVPNFELVDQQGSQFRLSDYRGKAVLLTFIYTRCPLPNYCPLISKNFASLQERLRKEFPGRFHLISVTFDPKYDTPKVLSDYASRWDADAASWTFGTGTPDQIAQVAGYVGVFYEAAGGLITHDLRTALIGPDGKLVHVWKSNVWTPYEVQRRVRETLTGDQHLAVR